MGINGDKDKETITNKEKKQKKKDQKKEQKVSKYSFNVQRAPF